jgi:hypothetical protein
LYFIFIYITKFISNKMLESRKYSGQTMVHSLTTGIGSSMASRHFSAPDMIPGSLYYSADIAAIVHSCNAAAAARMYLPPAVSQTTSVALPIFFQGLYIGIQGKLYYFLRRNADCAGVLYTMTETSITHHEQ